MWLVHRLFALRARARAPPCQWALLLADLRLARCAATGCSSRLLSRRHARQRQPATVRESLLHGHSLQGVAQTLSYALVGGPTAQRCTPEMAICTPRAQFHVHCHCLYLSRHTTPVLLGERLPNDLRPPPTDHHVTSVNSQAVVVAAFRDVPVHPDSDHIWHSGNRSRSPRH
eukprot:COSAG02_NODE_1396_length_12898_cov_23.802953_9_plen_172_part_00